MRKKMKPKFPECCAKAKQLDRNIGGAICTAAKRNPKTGEYETGKTIHLRDEWHFNLCPYCGKKIKGEKG